MIQNSGYEHKLPGKSWKIEMWTLWKHNDKQETNLTCGKLVNSTELVEQIPDYNDLFRPELNKITISWILNEQIWIEDQEKGCSKDNWRCF